MINGSWWLVLEPLTRQRESVFGVKWAQSRGCKETVCAQDSEVKDTAMEASVGDADCLLTWLQTEQRQDAEESVGGVCIPLTA